MSLTKKIKNTFTKEEPKDELEQRLTSNSNAAAEELISALNRFEDKLEAVREENQHFYPIGGMIIKTSPSTPRGIFYENHYIHTGPKNMQIDELFKYYVINKVVNKGGIFSGFRNWSKGIHSELKSIVSKSRSEIAKTERIADTDRKKHWLKFYDIASKAYEELRDVFYCDNSLNKKFVENTNSRLNDKGVKENIYDLRQMIVSFLPTIYQKKADLNRWDGRGVKNGTMDKETAIDMLVKGINRLQKKVEKNFISGIIILGPPSDLKNPDKEYFDSHRVKRGPKFKLIEERFKKAVIKGSIDIEEGLEMFGKWSKETYSKLKAITSKAHSKMAKIEKLTDTKDHWSKFFEIEIEALEKTKEVFNPTTVFNKKFIESMNSKQGSEDIEKALNSLNEEISEVIAFTKKLKESLNKLS